MINKYLITSLTFFLVTIAGFVIYLNSETPIPVLYSPEGPIRELPTNVPEMHRPENIPCIYSLWKNNNESCGTSENIFEEKHILHMIKNIRQNYPPSLWNTVYQLTKQGHITDEIHQDIDIAPKK